ncbi:hypothetical protein EYF80_002577 [Liparis tanakae]|uniref:Uncharacterized protein n=1 Tax=Liparis tanakae TaxID=230148 RepID=A0A4Z2JB20_9TELE|nr:hypothetical protein EYF80_002577 [Liparis tanakae]
MTRLPYTPWPRAPCRKPVNSHRRPNTSPIFSAPLAAAPLLSPRRMSRSDRLPAAAAPAPPPPPPPPPPGHSQVPAAPPPSPPGSLSVCRYRSNVHPPAPGEKRCSSGRAGAPLMLRCRSEKRREERGQSGQPVGGALYRVGKPEERGLPGAEPQLHEVHIAAGRQGVAVGAEDDRRPAGQCGTIQLQHRRLLRPVEGGQVALALIPDAQVRQRGGGVREKQEVSEQQ